MRGSGSTSPSIILEEFPGIPLEYTEVLKTRGIHHTLEFSEATRTGQQREALAADTGIPVGRIEEIRSLCDLSRIEGIQAVVVRALFYAGIRSVQALAEQNGAVLWERLTSISFPYRNALLPLKVEETEGWVKRARSLEIPETGQVDHD